MKNDIIARLTLAAIIAFSGSTIAQDAASPDGPGWTGSTDPEDMIAARQALMLDAERLMRPIDAFAAGDESNPQALRSNAESIAAMLLASAHLYPPTTDRYDPDADMPETLAMPAIWENFAAFYRLSAATADAASAMVTAEAHELGQAAAALRASCDACHAAYLRPYEPAQVTDEDLDFDFDSVFGPD